MVGQPGLVRLGGYERFDVVDVGAGKALQFRYLHDPDALHGLDHLLPLVDVAGQFAEPAVRQCLDKRGLAARLGQRQSYSAGTNPSIRCRRPSRAPMKMAAKVRGAEKARSEKADRPCPMLQPRATTAPTPIMAAPKI
jgi:hypothetical protein